MKSLSLTVLLSLLGTSLASADWPQWRGPHRNGIADESLTLPSEWTDANAPTKLWESGEIPSDHYGGHGSVVVADGKVFLSVVWHREEPTEKRRIDGLVMGNLGFRGVNFAPEVTAKMEHDRLNLNARLRGKALEDWAQKWVDDNLTKEEALVLGSWVISRFKLGKTAISLEDFDKLRKASNITFANQAELEAWVKEQGFDPAVEERVIKAVPSTEKVADDVILCHDAGTGEEVWRFQTPGNPTGRSSSSTPAVADGRVYAALSTHVYAVDASTGEEVWRAPFTGKKGPASSPLVVEGSLFLQQNSLICLNADTGELLWENKQIDGANSSPALWESPAGPVILANARKDLVGVNAQSGETLWKTPAGGDATPVVSGNYAVVLSKAKDKNLSAFRLSENGATPLWSRDFLARRYDSSPIIHEGAVYHLGSERHMCVDLESGEIKWERQASASISSPVLADGKLLVYDRNGGFITMIKATPEDYTPLGDAKIGALKCASPAFSDSKMFIRTPTSIACFDLGGGETE